MPKGCCGGDTCACKIVSESDSRISITGSGQPTDPFVFDLEAERISTHNDTFDTIAGGAGTLADPWTVETFFAPTAKLNDFPDVNAPGPSNGQVLAWNSATSRWVAQAPTVAPTGAVTHDSSLFGDGSPGTPLGVQPVTQRLLGTFTAGLGLTDLGMASVVQHFVDATDRSTNLPSPRINSLSMLDNNLGVVEYWNGSKWLMLPNQTSWSVSDELLELSGSYVAGSPVTVVILQVSTTTNSSGVFDVVSPAVLTGRSGVLTVSLQEVGSPAWKAMIYGNTDRISGTAYRVTDGSLLVGTPITLTVQALLY